MFGSLRRGTRCCPLWAGLLHMAPRVYLPLKRGGRRAHSAFTRVCDALCARRVGIKFIAKTTRADPHPYPPLFKGRECTAAAAANAIALPQGEGVGRNALRHPEPNTRIAYV